MRIDSRVIQNSSIAVKSVKKNEKQNKESRSFTQPESLELSDAAQLLNKLLHATSNQFSPYPFYFVNAAARNIKQASTISKNIQNQAESMGVLLNYTMIYDMVINLANQYHNILWTPRVTAEYEALNTEEKSLFEKLHSACLENQTPVSVIESTALKYVQFKQARAASLPDRRECATYIIDNLRNEPILNHNNVKKSLSTIIKQYVTQTLETH